MTAAMMVAVAAIVCAVSGVPALLAASSSRAAQKFSTSILIAGCVIGLAGAVLGLFSPSSYVTAPWSIPGAALHIRVDALSAFFVLPVFLVAAAGSLFGEGYWAGAAKGGYLRLFYGLLTAGLAMVMVAQNTILFLVAWEVVAITAFFLVVTFDEQEEVRRSAWLYLVASHVSTLTLFALVAILHSMTGSWELTQLPAGAAATSAGIAVLWLGLVGFGIKAGVMPFHVWLPGAHAGAPSHVSAIMSGVVIKMGVYGIVRMLTLFGNPPAWFGGVLLLFGIVSSIFGVAFALAQHDLKRLLAYHSIENIGIIVTGVGIGVVGNASGMPVIGFLGYAGALLHVWNHGLFKALLFLGAGSAIHGSGTREIDRMGGLAKRMPWTAGAFLVGAVAICGLPPLNGFISEWLLYLGSFASTQRLAGGWQELALIIVAPALAVTGALALACFVKAFGAVFLGEPRSAAAGEAHEAKGSMLAAMLPLAIGCFAIGLLPAVIAPAIENAATVAGGARGTIAAALTPVQTFSLILTALLAIAFVAVRRVVGAARREGTWDCGYANPTARMQYTSSSFARGLIAFFAWAMPPVVHEPHDLPLFPATASLETHVPDTVLDRTILPAAERTSRLLMLARRVQSGRMQAYLVYIAATLFVLLVWSAQ